MKTFQSNYLLREGDKHVRDLPLLPLHSLSIRQKIHYIKHDEKATAIRRVVEIDG